MADTLRAALLRCAGALQPLAEDEQSEGRSDLATLAYDAARASLAENPPGDANSIRADHAALCDACGLPSYEQLTAQRDALRAALESIERIPYSLNDSERCLIGRMARAALEAAK